MKINTNCTRRRITGNLVTLIFFAWGMGVFIFTTMPLWSYIDIAPITLEIIWGMVAGLSGMLLAVANAVITNLECANIELHSKQMREQEDKGD